MSGKNIVDKIFSAHLAHGKLEPGQTIGLGIDEVYTQDATGTMAWLQFEAIGVDRVKIPLAISFVDHNTMQSDFMNADDHAFLESVAAKFGGWFSRPGNGISHQINLERFAVPGRIALGTDSHTPTGGGKYPFVYFGVWSLIPGLWSLILGLWYLVFSLWSLVFGLWSLVFGFRSLVCTA